MRMTRWIMNKKLIIIIVAVLLALIVVGVAIFMFVLRGNGDDTPEPVVYQEFPLGEQYTNIKQAESATRKTVLKYSPVIQFTNAEIETVLTEKKTIILTEMRKYFMERTAEQLERLDRVQEDLTDIVIEITETDPDTITNVLMLEYITQ